MKIKSHKSGIKFVDTIQTYKDMRKPTWGDCSVRALASAKGYSYGVAQMKLKEYRASDRSGIGTNEWINHLIFKEGFDLVVNYEKAFIKARKECRRST